MLLTHWLESLTATPPAARRPATRRHAATRRGPQVGSIELLEDRVLLASTPIAVVNSSFEDAAQGDGGFTRGVITGWNAPSDTGVFNPVAPGSHYSVAVPDGVQVAYSNGSTITQILGTNAVPGATYTLQVEIGDRLDTAVPGYTVELWAGGTLLGSVDETDFPTSNGGFVTATLIATNSSNAAGPLEIRLDSDGVQTNFDNVHLTETTAGLLYVNDNWVDLDGGSLEVGDTVRNDNDTVNAGNVTAVYGVNAFGVANTGALPAFDEIEDAIDAASAGDTINVLDGTYNESVTVDQSVTLLGAQSGVNPALRTDGAAGESIIISPAGLNAFTVSAPNVTIDGFDVSGTAGGVQGIGESTSLIGTTLSHNFVHDFSSIGVALAAGSSGALVSENKIFGNYAGVYLSTGSTNVQVLANEIRDHAGGPLDQGSAVVLEGNNTDVSVANNFLTNNAKAVYVWNFGSDFSGTSISGNSITPAVGGQGVVNTNTTTINASGTGGARPTKATLSP